MFITLTSINHIRNPCWSKPSIMVFKVKCNEWMAAGIKSYTATGNVSALTEVIKKSFRIRIANTELKSV